MINYLLQYTIIQTNTTLLRYQPLFTNATKYLLIHTKIKNKSKRSHCISLSKDSFEDDPDWQEIPEELILNLSRTRIHYFCFSASTTQEGASPIPPNVELTAYDLIMLEVEDILPSPLTPLVLPPPEPKPVCEMQTPSLFTIAQSSPQPQSVDTANYARVNPLLLPASSSSSSVELHLYIDSEMSSSPAPVGPQSSSQELLLQGNNQVPQPPPLFSTAHTAVSTSQPPPQPTSFPS